MVGILLLSLRQTLMISSDAAAFPLVVNLNMSFPSTLLASQEHTGYMPTLMCVCSGMSPLTRVLTISDWQGHYIDGLRAPLIIHPPKETFSYDDEFTVVISDWFHEEHSVLVKDFISPLNPNGIEPAAGVSSMLIRF